MSTFENPPPTIQTEPSEERIVLPPPPQAPPQPEGTGPVAEPDLGEQLAWLDGALLVLLLGLAFVLASFPIRNSDFYRDLAVGRLIVQGQYHFGQDPFSFATGPTSWANAVTGEKVVWVNHSWLSSLLVYGLYSLAPGGLALVIFRGLLVMALAVLLVLAGRRPGQKLWIPAVCAVLALVVLSPRLWMQPVLFSYLFLALTLYLLERSQASLPREGEQPRRTGALLWLLPPLFVLWVNLDGWFLLGLVTVALYLVGALLQRAFGPSRAQLETPGADAPGSPAPGADAPGSPAPGADAPGSPTPGADAPGSPAPRLALILVVSLAACLINPYHLHAFTLPAQLGFSESAQALRADGQFSGMFLSPLSSSYFRLSAGLSVAGLSYFLLLVLSILALVLAGRKELNWGRTLVVASFALLSLSNARCIPFFAVTAGPITALSLLAWSLRRQQDSETGQQGGPVAAWHLSPEWLLAGRWLSLVGVVLLLVASIPGWLQASPHSGRRVGWRLVPEPSVEQLGQQIASWRSAGLLPDKVEWFNTHPDLGNYFAWYCPGEKVFFDSRVAPFPATTVRDREKIRTTLAGSPPGDPEVQEPEASKGNWRQVLKDRHGQFFLFYKPTAFSVDADLFSAMRAPAEWTLLYMDGKTAGFAWNKAGKIAPKLKYDLHQQAFGPDAARAPETRPARAPRVQPWYAELWSAPLESPLDANLAQMAHLYFNAQREPLPAEGPGEVPTGGRDLPDFGDCRRRLPERQPPVDGRPRGEPALAAPQHPAHANRSCGSRPPRGVVPGHPRRPPVPGRKPRRCPGPRPAGQTVRHPPPGNAGAVPVASQVVVVPDALAEASPPAADPLLLAPGDQAQSRPGSAL